MAQNQIQNLALIRVRGNAVMSHLVSPIDYNGNQEYELGISDVKFEDANSYNNPEAAQKAIDAFKKRIKNPKKDGQKPVLWLKTPAINRNQSENHIAYLDMKTKKQIPTAKEIAQGTTVTAYVNCYVIPNSAMLSQYDGVAGRLQAVAFDDASTESNWYTPGNGIAGFQMLSDDEAYGNHSTAPSAPETTATENTQSPFESNSQSANAQGASGQSSQSNPFAQNDQSSTEQSNPFAQNDQTSQPNNGGLFGGNSAQQNNGGLFGGQQNGNTPQNPSNNLFGGNNQ